ncbi:MAG: cupin domain-containing protein [Syntrophobacteraceae bacterium]
MDTYRLLKDIAWRSHPIAEGVSIKHFISAKEQDLDVTCMLVKVPVGIEVPEHVHSTQDDILYPLAGRAVMWVDGAGEFILEPGAVIRVPKGIRHKISRVEEELLILDVFSPALF